MKDILHKNIVLVLNRNWQAVAVTSPAQAFSQMATDSATALDIQGADWMQPTKWGDWCQLPVRDGDDFIGTPHGAVRVPTVIVLCRYARVPMHYPKLNARNIWLRDGGKCQYTGKLLMPGEGNIDHVMPQSRGGATSWENCVLSARDVNTRKADRTPDEAGLRLRVIPKKPAPVPVTATIRNVHEIPDWEPFLLKVG